MQRIPVGQTKIEVCEGGGSYKVASLSRSRYVAREVISALRMCIAAFLTYQGTQFLVYTIAIEELLLNAVALEFVISLDELIFESLAPAHAKRVVAGTTGIKLPTTHWSGMDACALVSLALIVAQLIWAYTTYLNPQLAVLQGVKDAVCAGDRDFVFGVDGMGVVTWGFPPSVRGTIQESADNGYTEWPPLEREDLYGTARAIDAIVSGWGRVACPTASCYFFVSPTSAPLPLPEGSRADCCLPQQTKAPSIDAGRFSVRTKTLANTADTNTMCTLYTRHTHALSTATLTHLEPLLLLDASL